MPEFPSIFISGSGEIEPISKELISRLEGQGLTAIRMPFGAKPIDAARESIRELSKCQAFVLILSSKYGTPWEELGGQSITELEFDEAIMRKLPIFCFIDSAPKDIEPRLRDFIKKATDTLKKDVLYDETPFENPEDCAELIFSAIRSFRWTPPSFSSFGEWENSLINHYTRLIGLTETPKELPPPIGREQAHTELLQWLGEAGGKNAAVISGLPGFGKTLFAYDFTRAALKDSLLDRPDILVVPPGQEISLDAIRQIVPAQKDAQRPILLIIDDADERPDLQTLIKALGSSAHFRRIKFLLTCQEGFEPDIYLNCSPYISQPDTKGIVLKKLPIEDLQSYVKTHNLNITDRVAISLLKITNGIPFYLDLYFNHRYDLNRICTHEKMRANFLEQMLGEIRTPGNETELGFLKALTLTGSISIKHPSFGEVAAALQIPEDRDAALKNLQERGLIYRVGTKQRVTNRIIQDFVLIEFWTKKPDSALILPLLQKVPDIGASILENLGRVEWALGVPFIPTMASPFDDVWAAIKVSLAQAKNAGERIAILKLFKDASYYLPGLSMDLVKITHTRFLDGLKNPDQKLSTEELEAVSDLAYALAFHRDDFETAIDFLWDFGKFDSRPLNACPSHAHRHLESLAEFRPGRDLARYEVILDHIEKWLREGKASDTPWTHSPIEIAREFLKHEWEETFFHGNVYTFRRGPLKHIERIENLKLKTVKLLGRCFKGEFGLSAMPESLHELRGQIPIYQPKDYRKVAEAALAELAAAADHHITEKRPAAAFAIFHTLSEIIDIFDRSDKREIDDATKNLAADVAESIKKNFADEYVVLRALLSDRFGAPDPAAVTAAQKALIGLGLDGALHLLEALHQDLEKLSLWPKTSAVATQNPADAAWREFSVGLHESILDKSTSPFLQNDAINFLFACRMAAQSDAAARAQYLDLLNRYCEKYQSMDPAGKLTQTLASSCRWFIRIVLGTEGLSLFPEELALVKSWKDSPDITWGIILGAIADKDVAQARELVLAAPMQTDKRAAHEICSVVMGSKALTAALDENDWSAFLAKFIEVREIDDYWLEQAIIHCSNLFPRIAASFFEKRIRLSEEREKDSESYYPLPLSIEHHFQNAFSKADRETRLDLIKGAMGFVIKQKAGALESYYYSNYVNLVAGRFIRDAKDILLEYAKSDNAAYLKALADVIQHSYSNFSLDHPDVVETLLNSAAKAGEETLRSVRGGLGAGAGTRSWSRTTGQPSATHVNLLKRATAIKRGFLPGSPAYEFYAALAESAEATLEREKLEDEEVLDN